MSQAGPVNQGGSVCRGEVVHLNFVALAAIFITMFTSKEESISAHKYRSICFLLVGSGNRAVPVNAITWKNISPVSRDVSR